MYLDVPGRMFLRGLKSYNCIFSALWNMPKVRTNIFTGHRVYIVHNIHILQGWWRCKTNSECKILGRKISQQLFYEWTVPDLQKNQFHHFKLGEEQAISFLFVVCKFAHYLYLFIFTLYKNLDIIQARHKHFFLNRGISQFP